MIFLNSCPDSIHPDTIQYNGTSVTWNGRTLDFGTEISLQNMAKIWYIWHAAQSVQSLWARLCHIDENTPKAERAWNAIQRVGMGTFYLFGDLVQVFGEIYRQEYLPFSPLKTACIEYFQASCADYCAGGIRNALANFSDEAKQVLLASTMLYRIDWKKEGDLDTLGKQYVTDSLQDYTERVKGNVFPEFYDPAVKKFIVSVVPSDTRVNLSFTLPFGGTLRIDKVSAYSLIQKNIAEFMTGRPSPFYPEYLYKDWKYTAMDDIYFAL